MALTREIDLDGILSLPLYTDLAPDADGILRNSAGQSFRADSPLLRAVLDELGQGFPRPVPGGAATGRRASDHRQDRGGPTLRPAR
jgi:hypothetical protein